MPSHTYLSASPVWDASLHRSKIIEYAMDDIAVVGDRRLGLVAEPLGCTEQGSGPLQSVRLQWLDGGPLPLDVLAVINLGGSPVHPHRRPVGESGVRLLVPAVDEPRELEVELPSLAVRFAVTLQPQRHWSVHLIHHSHLDIGYTDPQAIVREQHLGYLDAVLRLARETDDRDDDARFRWSEEALFSVTDWLADRTSAQREEFIARVGEGRISLSAMPFNLHTEMCSTDELYELLRPARELKHRYGLDFRTAMQTDVPGAVAGLPDALGSLGVQYLSVAHNWAGRSDPDGSGGGIDLPRLFRWQGPEGHSVIVWRTDSPHGMAYMEGPMVGFHESYNLASDLFPAYLSSLSKRPYPLMPGSVFGWLDTVEQSDRQPYPWDILHLRVHGSWSDNAGPSRTISDVVAEWNAAWDFPKLRLSTNEDFFDAALERVGDQLQTYVGDWNDWWAHGVGSAAAPVAVGRRAQAALADAQTLSATARLLAGSSNDQPIVNPNRGYQQIALWDEHTWGASNSWNHSDIGSSSGEHQWYWKVARAYEALDEAEHGLQQAGAVLTEWLGSSGDASVYLFNTSGQPRTETGEFFVPASVIALDHAVQLTDGRTGATLDYDEQVEEQRSRGLGRYLRTTVANVPAVGLVRLDLTATPRSTPLQRTATARAGDLAFENAAIAPSQPHPDAGRPDELLLESDHLRVELDQRDGTICSIVDKTDDREVINTDAALGFNAYVYDRYATIGNSNHNSSKFTDPGNLALLSSRGIGGAVAVTEAGTGAVDSWLQVSSSVPGAEGLVTTYRLRHDRAQLDIVNRLTKPVVRDKESAFFAFPFAVEQPRVLQESAGGLSGPNADRVPGGAQYLTAIRHWIGIGEAEAGTNNRAIGWASADVPLVEVGHIALPYVPFPNTMPVDEPATIYSWVHNNIWDTNFPSTQTFEMDFRYSVRIGHGDAPSLAADTAESLVRPLRPVIAAGSAEPLPQTSLLEIDDPRVRLVGLHTDEAGMLVVRMICTAADGATVGVRLPEGSQAAHRATYWGDSLEQLPISNGRIQVPFTGAGAQAIRLG